ncbi:MAG: multidrug efflux pump subunit MdtA [Candidatus Desulfovibrio kirbyi]|uniref:Multidrug efflux pump subunit MdtA n=1 Tax=Candidatus Desulfovibrio kirbyi TaxID=2696086 RepID=A0A6L2R7E8_9BACT|nr:MAG: multidrug efflux pump subunit MdtA [Candidatus Desulfovibrio kirbyi]
MMNPGMRLPCDAGKRKIVYLLVAAIALFFVWRLFVTNGQPGQGVRENAPPVRVAEATARDVPHYLNGLGTVIPSVDVLVTSRVDGQLVRLHFSEGQRVRTGDLLAEIDPRPFQAALDEALGALARDKAQLDNAYRDLARYARLVAGNFIAAQQYETQRALTSQYEGTVEADTAAVAAARLQLEYSRIPAPASGRLGLRYVDEGNMIKSSDTNGLVRITEESPCDVVFTLPESRTPLVMRALRLREGNPDMPPLPVEAWDQEEKRRLDLGVLLSVDNQIDAATGTIKLKARFPNTEATLYPNQFVNARLLAQTLENAVVVPTGAVQLGARGAYVFVVDGESIARVCDVKCGISVDGLTVIDEGIGPGVFVVTDGVDRLRDGMTVTVTENTARR